MANLFWLILLSCSTMFCESYPLLQADIQSSQVKTLYRRSTTGLTNFMLQTLWTIVNKNSESRKKETGEGEDGSTESRTGGPEGRTPGGFERRGQAGSPHSIRCYFNAVSCFY